MAAIDTNIIPASVRASCRVRLTVQHTIEYDANSVVGAERVTHKVLMGQLSIHDVAEMYNTTVDSTVQLTRID